MELDSRDGKLRVLYGDRLLTLLTEVRQLSSLGYDIPPKIIKCAEMGKKFYQYGVELQAVSWRLARSLIPPYQLRSHISTTRLIRR